MSLTTAMQIARSGLTAAQLGIQLSGNNIANVATPGYSRQVATLVPQAGYGTTVGAGTGVLIRDIQRQVDTALQGRLWGSTSDQAAAQAQYNILSQVESTLGTLNDGDLSSQLSSFFSTWSELANQTQSGAAVVQQGVTLAAFIRRLRSDLTGQKSQLDTQLSASVTQADQLMAQIARMNGAISQAESSGGTANALRDQRDQLTTQLAGLMDVTLVDRGSQGVDVLVGSVPVVLGANSRGLQVRYETVNGEPRSIVATGSDGSELSVAGGAIGGLLSGRGGAIDDTVGKLDTLASRLIFEVNKLHAVGTNSAGLSSVTGFLQFASADRTLALNDPNNTAMAGLPFAPVNGGFEVRVRNTTTGDVQSYRINVDLDGIDSAGAPGFGDDTSLADLAASLNAVAGLSASIGADGRLSVSAAGGYDFSFADDSSSVLGVLGLNSYFTGTDASSIDVRADLRSDSTRLTAGRIVNGVLVENSTALGIAGLQSQGLTALGGRSLSALWRDTAANVGAQTATAQTTATAAGVVRDSLQSQRDAVSAVSIDEESINLLSFQRQYQGAAKVISVADEMTQTLLSLL